jgi:hypothetical protein
MSEVARLDCPCCGEPSIPALSDKRRGNQPGPVWEVGDKAPCPRCGCVCVVEEGHDDGFVRAGVDEGCAGWEGKP